ncbi:Solute carrier family 46 member 3 [Chelonia mydas]|uniref:Solute carrier family 46 member 3 n=1 Tax=Chelonia mydas TaxID=8469 RepID=M7BZQ7_CHEMY|nr:Solute carrier family 46 member 3 [Chelonia mydas]
MKKVLLVEPVIVIYAFASFLTAPLIQQYIYQRLWEEASNSSLIENNNTTYCERNKSNPTYIKQKVDEFWHIVTFSGCPEPEVTMLPPASVRDILAVFQFPGTHDFKAYYQYVYTVPHIVLIHILHNDINGQCVIGFHFIPHTTFFMDNYCDSNVLGAVSLSGLIGVADRTVSPLPVGIEGFLVSHTGYVYTTDLTVAQVYRCSCAAVKSPL